MSEEKIENNNKKNVRSRRTNSQVKRTNTRKVNKKESETKRTARVGKRNVQKEVFKSSKLKIIPLGGLHEIGKNITVFEYENEMIVVDCGLSFPED